MKKIVFKGENIEQISEKIQFHEFIHGITDNGAKRYIRILEDVEEYCYGVGVNEGVVSYIENMKDSKTWQKFYQTGAYDAERRIIGQVNVLYQNLINDNEPNFVEQYILDPEGTLPRINKIFKEDIKNENRQEGDREIELLAMRSSLNFIIELDDINRGREIEDEEMKQETKNQKMKSLEQILIKLYVGQVSRTEVTTQKQLYKLLYQIEGFNQNLSERSEVIEALKREKIEDLLKRNPKQKLYNLLRKLPKRVEDSPSTSEMRLLSAVFGDGMPEDSRYDEIKKSIEEVQNDRSIPKEDIGRAFGIAVPIGIKESVAGEIEMGVLAKEEDIITNDKQ